MADDPALIADCVAARIRLAKASDAWLDAVEADFVTEERWEAIRSEYLDARLAVCEEQERTDG